MFDQPTTVVAVLVLIIAAIFLAKFALRYLIDWINAPENRRFRIFGGALIITFSMGVIANNEVIESREFERCMIVRDSYPGCAITVIRRMLKLAAAPHDEKEGSSQRLRTTAYSILPY